MNRELTLTELAELATVGPRTWIYFITTKDHPGPIKIGWAVDPDKRFREIQACSPYPLRLLGYIEGGVLNEGRLHEYFASYRLHGEWFESHILPYVREILSLGTFR